MRIALAWQSRATDSVCPDPQTVVQRLVAHFAPVLGEPLPDGARIHVRSCGAAHLVAVELPVAGWTAPFFAEDAKGYAFAPDPPLFGSRSVRLESSSERDSLLRIGEDLARDPLPLLRELCPPFSMVWADGRTLRVQTDGLGQGQWFEFQDSRLWAVSNRIGALEALGIPLVPASEEWAVRLTLGWFPESMSGYRDIRLLPPATQVVVGPDTVTYREEDVLSEWVHPSRMSEDDCLELVRTSIVEFLANASRSWKTATVGLSGGWDSRAVAAVLGTLGVPHELRVRGHPARMDVMVASELARIAGRPLRIKTESGIPPSEVEACRRCIQLALRWQAGHMTLLKHKTFLARHKALGGGVVNVMGQHSGILKGDYAARIRATEIPAHRCEEVLLDALMEDAPTVLRPELRGPVREVIRRAYRAARRYGLEGLHPLHFFFLNEYTRRWGAATVASQTGMVLTPFLQPDVIRAAYAFPPERLPNKPFHAHITRHHAPEWADFPYESELTEADVKAGRIRPVELPVPGVAGLPRWRKGRWGKYSHKRYWREVGRPLLEEALAEPGWWVEILDPDLVRATWQKTKGVADAVVVAHLVGGPPSAGTSSGNSSVDNTPEGAPRIAVEPLTEREPA